MHRDVKPANFALCPPSASPTDGTWVLIDFGLARRCAIPAQQRGGLQMHAILGTCDANRCLLPTLAVAVPLALTHPRLPMPAPRYVDDAGAVLPERPEAPFRGSTSYASVPIMEQRDQGRRDDLWSWLYILVELLEGALPWRAPEREAGTAGGGGAASGSGAATDMGGAAATAASERSKGQVLAAKQQCIANPDRLFNTVRCPTVSGQTAKPSHCFWCSVDAWAEELQADL